VVCGVGVSACWGSVSPDDGTSHATHSETPTFSEATFAAPDLTVFCRLDELGLEVTGLRVEADRVVLACRVVEPGGWCGRCGSAGLARDMVTRRLAHEPFGWRPTTLAVTVRRYRCGECSRGSRPARRNQGTAAQSSSTTWNSLALTGSDGCPVLWSAGPAGDRVVARRRASVGVVEQVLRTHHRTGSASGRPPKRA